MSEEGDQGGGGVDDDYDAHCTQWGEEVRGGMVPVLFVFVDQPNIRADQPNIRVAVWCCCRHLQSQRPSPTRPHGKQRTPVVESIIVPHVHTPKPRPHPPHLGITTP